MLKRLRDRSTLRPPPSEPPVKRRVPPEPFPLEAVPSVFNSYILEKMSYNDFKTFNLGSQLTAAICEDLMMIKAELKFIHIKEESAIAQSIGFTTRTAPLSTVPRRVRLHTDILTVNKKSFDEILQYKISAGFVNFGGETGLDPDFVKEVIQLTGTQKISVRNVSWETLALEEVKELKYVDFRVWENFSDFDLLDVKLEFFIVTELDWLDPTNIITSDGVLQLIKEWKEGKRNIGSIKIPVENLNEDMILRELNGYREYRTNRLILCKGDGTTDCVVDTRERRVVKLSKRNCTGKH